MPFSSPDHLRQQHVRLFTSNDRSSAVEHLTHMDRLADVRFSPTRGIKDRPDVDFRMQPNGNDRLTVAMQTKLRKEYEEEEARIVRENGFLMDRLIIHASTEERRRKGVNLIPVPEPKPFAEQGSNIVAKKREAERVQEANETLMLAMATSKPSISNGAIKKSVEKHNELVKRISRFRPAQNYVGENLMIKAATGRAPTQPCGELQWSATAASKGQLVTLPSPHGSSARRQPWQDVSPHDVVHRRRVTDRMVRSVFLRDEDEVLAEAAAMPKQSDVTSRRMTWTELGQEFARTPRPPTKGTSVKSR